MKPGTFVSIIIICALAGLALSWKSIFASAKDNQEPAATQAEPASNVVGLATPTVIGAPETQPAPAATPTSSFDVRATELAIAAVVADTDKVVAETNLQIIEITKSVGDANNQLALDESARLSVDMGARATVAILKAESAKKEIEIKATQTWAELQISQRKADAEVAWADVTHVLAWGLIILLAFIVIYYIARNMILTIHQARQAENYAEPETSLADDLNRLPLDTANIQVTNTADGSYEVMIDDWSGIATLEQLLAVARGIEAGVSLAVKNWYGAESWQQPPVFSRSQYEGFVKAITLDGVGPTRRILAYAMNGHAVMRLSGKLYFKQLLERYG